MTFKEFISHPIKTLTTKIRKCFSTIFNRKWLDRLISVINNTRGEATLPLDKLEALADAIFPRLIYFFSSKEGKQALLERKSQKEAEEKIRVEQIEDGKEKK